MLKINIMIQLMIFDTIKTPTKLQIEKKNPIGSVPWVEQNIFDILINSVYYWPALPYKSI